MQSHVSTFIFFFTLRNGWNHWADTSTHLEFNACQQTFHVATDMLCLHLRIVVNFRDCVYAVETAMLIYKRHKTSVKSVVWIAMIESEVTDPCLYLSGYICSCSTTCCGTAYTSYVIWRDLSHDHMMDKSKVARHSIYLHVVNHIGQKIHSLWWNKVLGHIWFWYTLSFLLWQNDDCTH